jgi:hypothetical protein
MAFKGEHRGEWWVFVIDPVQKLVFSKAPHRVHFNMLNRFPPSQANIWGKNEPQFIHSLEVRPPYHTIGRH